MEPSQLEFPPVSLPQQVLSRGLRGICRPPEPSSGACFATLEQPEALMELCDSADEECPVTDCTHDIG